MITASALGVSSAPNTPCSARPATSTSIVGASAQTTRRRRTRRRRSRTRAARRRGRRASPRRGSASRASAGRRWRPTAGRRARRRGPRGSPGSATLTTVASRPATNEPMIAAARASCFCRAVMRSDATARRRAPARAARRRAAARRSAASGSGTAEASSTTFPGARPRRTPGGATHATCANTAATTASCACDLLQRRHVDHVERVDARPAAARAAPRPTNAGARELRGHVRAVERVADHEVGRAVRPRADQLRRVADLDPQPRRRAQPEVLARQRDDARVELEHELARARPRRLDVARQRARAAADVQHVDPAPGGPERVDQVRDPAHVGERQRARVGADRPAPPRARRAAASATTAARGSAITSASACVGAARDGRRRRPRPRRSRPRRFTAGRARRSP